MITAAAAGDGGLMWWQTLMLFVGIPALSVTVIGLLAYRPWRARPPATFPVLGTPGPPPRPDAPTAAEPVAAERQP